MSQWFRHSVPLGLTLGRVLCGGGILWGMSNQTPVFSIFCFSLGILTDFWDGFLARRWQCTSKAGQILDPIADKVLFSCAFFLLYRFEILPTWFVAWVLVRESLVVSAGFLGWITLKALPIQANWAGKFVTIVQSFLVFAGLFLLIWPHSPLALHFPLFVKVTFGVSVLTFLIYAYQYIRHLKNTLATFFHRV